MTALPALETPDRDGPLAVLDPRTRIVVAVLAVATLLAIQHAVVLLGLLAAAATGARLSGLSVPAMLHRL
ncbi:hypothetical protein J8J40_32830, partial [Mycobacterium tuberculosis]|nr:hypothetical protein [Mycobacterium tuberculosis]